MIKLIKIKAQTLKNIINNSQVINHDTLGKPKTLYSSDQNLIYKIYRKLSHRPFKKSPSRRTRRFIKNSLKFKSFGIYAPEVTAWLYCPKEKTYCIAYERLPGNTFKEYFAKHPSQELIKALAKTVHTLHAKNIYFRAGHADNYIYHDRKIGIIDIDNCRFYQHLNQRRKLKNLNYIREHALENQYPLFNDEQWQYFLDCYATFRQ